MVFPGIRMTSPVGTPNNHETGVGSKRLSRSAPVARRCRISGFTLVELLVVMLIIGLMTGVAVMSLSVTDHDESRLAAKRLISVMRLAHEEAEMQGRNLALGFWQRGWRFYQLDALGKWHPLRSGGLMRPRRVPSDLRFTLQLQGLDVALAPEDQTHPQVFLLASGEMQPFTLYIKQDGKRRIRIQGDPLGQLRQETLHAD